MMGLSALNFTLPVRAESHGHSLQTIYFQYLQYKSNIYSINQIKLGEHEHEKYCGSAHEATRRQQGQLIWRGTNSSEKKYKIKINN